MAFLSGPRSFALALLLALSACGDGSPKLTSEGGECTPGSQGCPCFNDACFGALECLGGTCIDPGGADSNPPVTDSGTTETPTTGHVTTSPTGATHSTQVTTNENSETGFTATSDSTGPAVSSTTTTGDPETGTTALDDTGPLDTGNFIPNDPGAPPGGMSDGFKQHRAPGQKCMPYSNDGSGTWNDAMCSDIDPAPDKLGASCSVVDSGTSGIDSCAAGSMCFNLPPGELDGGTCTPFCKGSAQNPTCSDPKTSCAVSNGGFLALCLTNCDPLASNCKAGQVCVPNNTAGTFVCVLDASNGADQGDSCAYANGCSPGFICITGDYVQNCNKNACCTAFCDTTLPNTCAGNPAVTCIPFYEVGTAPPGYEDVGICGITP